MRYVYYNTSNKQVSRDSIIMKGYLSRYLSRYLSHEMVLDHTQ